MLNFDVELANRCNCLLSKANTIPKLFTLAFAAFLLGASPAPRTMADTSPAPESQSSLDQPSTSDAPPVMLNLGGYDLFTIHATVGGLTPQERIDQIDTRLTPLLGVASIPPDAVRIYNPAGGFPSIYVFGRRIVTVDKKTTVGEGATSPLSLAQKWAGRFQQVLPRVNWRPSNAPEPVIPKHPKIIVATTLSNVGGSVGDVKVAEKLVIRLRGVQPAGMTAAERSDLLRSRIYSALKQPVPAPAPPEEATIVESGGTTAEADLPANDTTNPTPAAPKSTPAAPNPAVPQVVAEPVDPKSADPNAPAELVINGTPIIAVDENAAEAAKQPSPSALAHSWAKNILVALGYPPPAAPSSASQSGSAQPQPSPVKSTTPPTVASGPAQTPPASVTPAAEPPPTSSTRAQTPSAPTVPAASASPPAPAN